MISLLLNAAEVSRSFFKTDGGPKTVAHVGVLIAMYALRCLGLDYNFELAPYILVKSPFASMISHLLFVKPIQNSRKLRHKFTKYGECPTPGIIFDLQRSSGYRSCYSAIDTSHITGYFDQFAYISGNCGGSSRK